MPPLYWTNENLFLQNDSMPILFAFKYPGMQKQVSNCETCFSVLCTKWCMVCHSGFCQCNVVRNLMPDQSTKLQLAQTQSLFYPMVCNYSFCFKPPLFSAFETCFCVPGTVFWSQVRNQRWYYLRRPAMHNSMQQLSK